MSTRRELLCRSSLPLVRIDSRRVPTGYASACLIDHQGSRLIISVAHAVGTKGPWAAQSQYFEDIQQTKVFQLPSFNFLMEGNLDSDEFKEVDFAYAALHSDMKFFKQEIDENTLRVTKEEEVLVHNPTFNEPDKSKNFGFAGLITQQLEEHSGCRILSSMLMPYDGLKLVGDKSGLLAFSLPFAHPGHKYFQGCSGAPILDESGDVVALVTGGSTADDEIYGVPLRKYRAALDILSNQN